MSSAPTGQLKTQQKAKAPFALPELQDKGLVKWNLRVAEDMGVHGVIIGRDILSVLKIDIKFSEQLVSWDGREMPFKPLDPTPQTHHHTKKAVAVSEATK